MGGEKKKKKASGKKQKQPLDCELLNYGLLIEITTVLLEQVRNRKHFTHGYKVL